MKRSVHDTLSREKSVTKNTRMLMTQDLPDFVCAIHFLVFRRIRDQVRIVAQSLCKVFPGIKKG